MRIERGMVLQLYYLENDPWIVTTYSVYENYYDFHNGIQIKKRSLKEYVVVLSEIFVGEL